MTELRPRQVRPVQDVYTHISNYVPGETWYGPGTSIYTVGGDGGLKPSVVPLRERSLIDRRDVRKVRSEGTTVTGLGPGVPFGTGQEDSVGMKSFGPRSPGRKGSLLSLGPLSVSVREKTGTLRDKFSRETTRLLHFRWVRTSCQELLGRVTSEKNLLETLSGVGGDYRGRMRAGGLDRVVPLFFLPFTVPVRSPIPFVTPTTLAWYGYSGKSVLGSYFQLS